MVFQNIISREMEEQARKIIPGGVMSNFKKEEGFHPTYMTHGQGARIFDVDGNEYIDFSLSFGPAILGHNNEHLMKALEKQVRRCYSAVTNDLGTIAAQKITHHVPSAQKVRFSGSGTDANNNALRVARGYTGKNMIVRFNGHYHGGLDDILGGIVTDSEKPIPIAGERENDFWSQIVNTTGRAEHALQDCFMVEWNDLPVLEKLFEEQGDDIAAVLMEPVMVNLSGCRPEPGYLEGVRELCTCHHVVLIFDEVLTGFRMGLSGAQGHFGVIPDMTTFAKALGGGVPVSAFCGKSEIMDVITKTEVVAGGTYNGHPLAMVAVTATIEELERNEGAAFKHIHKMGTMLKDGLDEIAKDRDLNLLLQGFPGAWTFTFSNRKKAINHKEAMEADMMRTAIFATLLKEKGVLTSFRFCTSIAHTEEDVQETLNRADDVMKTMQKM